jgi:hypothetical protein
MIIIYCDCCQQFIADCIKTILLEEGTWAETEIATGEYHLELHTNTPHLRGIIEVICQEHDIHILDSSWANAGVIHNGE